MSSGASAGRGNLQNVHVLNGFIASVAVTTDLRETQYTEEAVQKSSCVNAFVMVKLVIVFD